MAAAKRQVREKPGKIEQRKVRGLEWGLQVEQTLLASPIYIGQAHGGGEGNGNLLQYSCRENPIDGRAWWAAVHGVARSRTRLMRLSSSSRPRGEEKIYKKRSQRARGLSLSCVLVCSLTLFSSRLWVGMPSHLEDGFSCYFLNKIEL